MEISLATRVSDIKGIGAHFGARLEKLNILTLKDLLYYLPFRYQDFSQITPIADIVDEGTATVYGQIQTIRMYRTPRRHMYIIEATIADDAGTMKAVWFNQKFIITTLKQGTWVNLAGKVAREGKRFVLQSPEYEIISHNADPHSGKHTGRLVPIYPETKGVTSRLVRFALSKVTSEMRTLPEFLPKNLLPEHHLPAIGDALYQIHFPRTLEEAEHAQNRIAFQDLFLLQLINASEQHALSSSPAHAFLYDVDVIKKELKTLPFELTLAQKKALYDILEDLKKPHATNRLLQGDVGSGKTIVAALAALVVARAKKQAVFMAPTEVLATQHYVTFTKFFPHFDAGIALLTASRSALFLGDGLETGMKKKDVVAHIAAGRVRIIIGTHAVLQKSVVFDDAAFIVIDEQHRFGVQQRASLSRRLTQIKTQIHADTDAETFLYKDLTYALRKAFFAVYNTLGSGHKESIYHRALLEELAKNNIAFSTEKQLPVMYAGKKVGTYTPDIIIDDRIILELKALPFIGSAEEKQTWNYLRGTTYRLALLVNFGTRELAIKRIVYDTARHPRSSASHQLKSASLSPHFLSMSATPIPRTLALTVFGDLELSLVNEMPKNRKPILTKIIPPTGRDDAYDFIRAQIKEGRQAYVVCPRIDPTDKDEKMTRAKLFQLDARSVKEEYEKLSKKIFSDLRVTMLHGQMKSDEKTHTMRLFKEGKIDVLVATSVIEVGVDVPNASIMMIEGSEHFGLSQLYQFRGRVGRGEHQSYCFLFTDINSKTTRDRLKALIAAKNGFELAEIDLRLRGPGQFLGNEQTGMPDIAAKAAQHPDFVKATRTAAQDLIAADPTLSQHPYLAAYLKLFKQSVHLE
ncbi:MAG: GxxExxY protein [Candidatus Paceibacterota bacterium]|jgi:ATP-dependent DNA helicase RecG